MGRVLLCHLELRALAEKIVRGSNLIRPGKINWGYFEDGHPNIFIDDVRSLRDDQVSFLASFWDPEKILEQMSVVWALPRYGVRSLQVILPYFPGTVDRVDVEGQIAFAMSLARLLSAAPLTRGGPPELVIYDIHALAERFYFKDGVLPRLESGMPLLIERLSRLPNIAVAFPDAGAEKRFGLALRSFPQITCTKIREGDKRIVTIKEGDPMGRHVVIVDDLVKTGGTILECKSVLLGAGASAISVYATHGVFPQNSWEKFCDNGFDTFWITDSCPVASSIDGIEPFKVLSLAPLIYNLIVSP